MFPSTEKRFNIWFILVAASLVAFITNGTRMSYGVFTVPLEQAFSLTRSQAVLPYALAMIVGGMVQPFAGILMDTKGPRRAIVISVVLLALGFIVTALSQNLWQLTLSYGLFVGVATCGFAFAAFSLLITRWFKQQRGKILGLVVASIPLSALVFSPLTASLISSFDWKGAFLILAAVILLVVFPIAWFFIREPDDTENSATKISLKGLFFNREVWQSVKAKPYWMLIVKYFGCGLAAAFILGHLPAIALEHGFSAQEGATALGLHGAGGAVGVILGGWASDRLGLYKTLVISYLIRALGLFLLAFFVRDLTSFYVFSVIAGVLSPLTIMTTHLLIYDIFGAGIAGRMMGLTFLIHQIGATIGPYFGGWVFEINGSYMWILVIIGIVLLNSAFWGWRLQEVAQKYISTRVNS